MTGSIVPVRYVPPIRAPKYEQRIIVDWLEGEVPRRRCLPTLDRIRGWRNREVFCFVRAYDWTDRMYR